MKTTPYRLFISHRSPFARRCRVAMLKLGVNHETVVLDVFNPTEEFLKANPLGRVPALQTPSGFTLPDSSSILEYLDENHGRRLWPQDPKHRLQCRIGSTLAEGVMEATVSWFLETQRKTAQSKEWMQEMTENIDRTLAVIHDQKLDLIPWMEGGKPTQSGFDLAIALEYLSLRHTSFDWARKYPQLSAILMICREDADFAKTAPPAA